MIYLKECRCFAKTNTAFFSSPPQTIASHERLSLQPLGFLSAVILQVLCHSIASEFLMPTSRFARYVHTAQSNRGSSRDNVPRNPGPTWRGMARPEGICTPRTPRMAPWRGVCTLRVVHMGACTAFAWCLHGLHGVCTLRAVCTGPCTGAVGTTRPAVSDHREPSPGWGRRQRKSWQRKASLPVFLLSAPY